MNEAQKRMILGSPRRGLGCRVKVRVMPATVDKWTISRNTTDLLCREEAQNFKPGGDML
jgi:hypothetical protein